MYSPVVAGRTLVTSSNAIAFTNIKWPVTIMTPLATRSKKMFAGTSSTSSKLPVKTAINTANIALETNLVVTKTTEPIL